MKEQSRKHQQNMPLTTKIKRALVPSRGKDAHKLYTDEYFSRHWFNHKDSDGIAVVAQLEGLTQKYVAHWMSYVFFKFFVQHTMLTKKLNFNNRPENYKNAYAVIWN